LCTMPFVSVPVVVPAGDASGVQAALGAVQIALLHKGPVGTTEIFHRQCSAARRTRAVLLTTLGIEAKFPAVFDEPPRSAGGRPFTLLTAIACADFLRILARLPGAQVRRLGGRAVAVVVDVPCDIYHSVDSRADPPGEGKGKDKGKGKGKGRGQGRGRGAGRGAAVDLDGRMELDRTVILTVEVALFDDRFHTGDLHGSTFRRLPSVRATELHGLIVVADLPVSVDVTAPLLLKAMVTELGISFDARILPLPVWNVVLDYGNATVLGYGAVATGFTVPFRFDLPPLALSPPSPPYCAPDLPPPSAPSLHWLEGASESGDPLADSSLAMLPLSVLLPKVRFAGVAGAGDRVLEAVPGSEAFAPILLYGGDVQRSGCPVQVSSSSTSSPAFAPRSILVGGIGSVADANHGLARLHLSVAAVGPRRGGAPSASDLAAVLGASLLRELNSAAGNRDVLGRAGQFCGRACREVAVCLQGVGLLPSGEASLLLLLPHLLAQLSLVPGVQPPQLRNPGPWAAFCCLSGGRNGCTLVGCSVAWPTLRDGHPSGLPRATARRKARDACILILRRALLPPPPLLSPAAALPAVEESLDLSPAAALPAVEESLDLAALADGEALSGLGGAAAPSSPRLSGGDMVVDDEAEGSSADDDGMLGGGTSPAASLPGRDTAPPGGPVARDEPGRSTPRAKRRAGGTSQTTGPPVGYGFGAPRVLPPDVRPYVPMLGDDPVRVDLGAIASVRPLAWGSWPAAGAVVSGSKRPSPSPVVTPVGTAVRQGVVSAETASGQACAGPAMHAAVVLCGGFGQKLSVFEVVDCALGNREQFACSLTSISFLLCRLAVAGLLHKCDADGRTVVFSFFSVN